MKLATFQQTQKLCVAKAQSHIAKRNVTTANYKTKTSVRGGAVHRSTFLRGVSLLGTTMGANASFSFSSAASQTPESILQDPQWPERWPYAPDSFARYDESEDTIFYDTPRIVTHIDDAAIRSLTKFYDQTFPPSGNDNVAVLDICSSWISHYPKGYTAGRVAGLGMNAEELKRNSALTEYAVKDLNKDPKLPYEDNSFDVITNAVSVDYLTRPLEVFREMHRCLKPGGVAIMSFSNRCFPTKAIAVWTQTGDLDHIWIVGSYFHYAGGFEPPQAKDITEKAFMGKTDPMYVVYARKQNKDL